MGITQSQSAEQYKICKHNKKIKWISRVVNIQNTKDTRLRLKSLTQLLRTQAFIQLLHSEKSRSV